MLSVIALSSQTGAAKPLTGWRAAPPQDMNLSIRSRAVDNDTGLDYANFGLLLCSASSGLAQDF